MPKNNAAPAAAAPPPRERILHFTVAKRDTSRLVIAICSLSGGGKTFSALALARGLAGPDGKICLVDTERRRALHYANYFAPWYYAELTPPYTPQRYVDALNEVEEFAPDVLILDSASHEWEGIGGILEMAESDPRLIGKGLAQWNKPKRAHKRFMNRLLSMNCHVILLVRAKEKFVQRKEPDPDRRGVMRDVIESVGFVPIQDKRFTYEMTAELWLDPERGPGIPEVKKCNGDLIFAFPEGEQLSTTTGERLRTWLSKPDVADAEVMRLRRAGEREADKGYSAVFAWWQTLSARERGLLLPYKESIKAMAVDADMSRQADRESEPEFDLPPGTGDLERGGPKLVEPGGGGPDDPLRPAADGDRAS